MSKDILELITLLTALSLMNGYEVNIHIERSAN